MAPELSIVIPVYNESENIAPLYQEVTAALAELGRAYEVIVVDDGSADPRWRVIRFRRNFGQAAGFAAGFAAARGQVVVTLDADLWRRATTS